MRTVVLLAGPSGSGKSRLAATVGCPRLNLDDFYRDGDAPDLPHTLGIVDWDDVETWDADAAVATIERLCATGSAEIPTYDIATSRRTGSRRLDLGPAAVYVAEGLFAPEIVPACRAAGVPVEALYLDRPRTQNLVFRFLRDVSEHRKPVGVLVRRGLALWRAEPAIRRHALAQGCRPVSLREAMAVVRPGADRVGPQPGSEEAAPRPEETARERRLRLLRRSLQRQPPRPVRAPPPYARGATSTAGCTIRTMRTAPDRRGHRAARRRRGRGRTRGCRPGGRQHPPRDGLDQKPGSVYLQTWHGSPLKRIHYDVLWAPPGRLDELDRDVARWDYLLSPNAISTPRLRDAFGFTGPVLEVGYPRNDLLSSPEAPAVRARVRASLGIADGVTAVLYTPTWRDDEYFADGSPDVRLALDPDDFVRALGPGYVLLPRRHSMVTHRAGPLDRDGVVDVSRHPDVPELYLAADVMITDYSSTMFDFAVTGKPMIFFAYDLAAYRDSIRGFYFDLEPMAPGPVLATSAEVLAALADLEAVTATYADRYRAFRQRFSHLEDGHASDRLRWLYDRSRRPTS